MHAVTLTGLAEHSHLLSGDITLDTHVADVANLIRWEQLTDVVLVGNSYGGMVITGVADREPGAIARLVYVNALVPADNDSVWDLVPDFRGVFTAGAPAGGGVATAPPPPERFDVSPADRDMVEELSTPRPFVFGETWEDSPFAGYPDRLSGQPGWQVVTVHAGPNLLLDDPDLVVEALVERPVG